MAKSVTIHNIELTAYEKTPLLEIAYPEMQGNYNEVEVDLLDVRATDGVRVSYDFDRDGFVIKQPVWDGEDIAYWKEVYFAYNFKYEFGEV